MVRLERLTEGSLAPVTCLERGSQQCARMADCPTLPVWRKLDELVNNYLDSVTLADLMATGGAGNDYVI